MLEEKCKRESVQLKSETSVEACALKTPKDSVFSTMMVTMAPLYHHASSSR